jgi:tetratricopeptide (TPR) repeat protein
MKSPDTPDRIEGDPDDRFIRDVFGARLKALKKTGGDHCPVAETLLDFHEGNLDAARYRETEDHLTVCPFCLDALDALRRAEEPVPEQATIPVRWLSVEKALDRSFQASLGRSSAFKAERPSEPDRRAAGRPAGKTGAGFWAAVFKPRHLVYSGALAAAGVLILYSAAFLSRGPYFSLARMEPERLGRMRSESIPSALTEGLNRYDEGRYHQAVILLERAVRTEPADYQARYYLGLSRIAAAEKKLPGLPYRFDAAEVGKGITDLEQALLLARDNDYYEADCRWILGKAFLMRGDVVGARNEFRRILQLKQPDGARKEAAQKMLSALR